MSEASAFSFELVGIASTFTERRLGVPIYQRSYAWGDQDKIGAAGSGSGVLDNICRALSSPAAPSTSWERSSSHVKDCMTVSPSLTANNALQQPQSFSQPSVMSSLSGATTTAHLSCNRSTWRQPTLTRRARTSAVLNADDNGYFQKRIIERDATAPTERRSHRLIDRAYSQLRSAIRQTADDAGVGWSQRLLDWVRYLAERVRVIIVEVPNEADAFLIFETLNDRGADLTIADLLKNYLLDEREND